MKRFLVLANQLLASIGTMLIFVQMLLICADIGGRFFFNSPLPGVFEVIELTIVAIVFLMLPNAIATESLVRSDALFTSLQQSKPRLADAMDLVFNIIGMLVFAAIAYGMWSKFTLAVERGHFTGNPGIFTAPIWPALLCIVIGSAWGALNFFEKSIASVTTKPADPAEKHHVGH